MEAENQASQITISLVLDYRLYLELFRRARLRDMGVKDLIVEYVLEGMPEQVVGAF